MPMTWYLLSSSNAELNLLPSSLGVSLKNKESTSSTKQIVESAILEVRKSS
jgi:hypothetical protein